jgi:hypothetical protein
MANPDVETQELKEPDLSFLAGTGVDLNSLTEKIKSQIEGEKKPEVKPEPKKEGEIKLPEVKEEVKKPEEIKKEEVKKPEPVKDYDNPFISSTKDKETPDVDIKDFEAASKYILENTGIEVKDIKDITKVVSKLNEVNQNTDNLNLQITELQDYKKVFEALPNEIFSVVQKWLNNEDYKEELVNQARSSIDFSLPFDKQDVKKVVDYYNPGKFSNEDYQDLESNTALQSVINMAKLAYKKDHDVNVSLKSDYQKKVDDNKKLFGESVNKSIVTLNKSVPYLRDGHKDKISKILQGGYKGIMGMFFDDKGLLKEDAGKLVALALYGEEAIRIHSENASRKTETKINEEFVTRSETKDEKKSAKTGGAKQTDEEVVENFKKEVIPTPVVNPFMLPNKQSK